MFNAKTIILAKALRPDLNFASPGAEELVWLKIASRYASGNPVRDATISNGIAYFDRVSVSQPLVSLLLNIPVTQTGSGTPSPDNIRDIIGFSGVNISRTGKNLLNNPDQTITGGSYVIDNVNAPMVAGYYILSFEFSGTDNSSSLRVDDENGTAIFTTSKTVRNGHNKFFINLPSNGSFVKLYSNAVGAYSKFQIEIGTESTAYEPYNSNTNTYSISFGQTVYSAILDVLTGKLYLTHELKTIDENSLIDMTSIPSVFYWNDFFDIANDAESVNCNCYYKDTNRANPNSVSGSNHDLTFCCRTSAPTLYIKDTRFTTIEDYKTWLSTNPVKIAVKLAEPIEIQLTPTQISTLIGENVIFADVADVTECKYTRK